MVGPHPNSPEAVIFSGELMVEPLIGWSGIILFGSLMPSHTGIGSSPMGINGIILFGSLMPSHTGIGSSHMGINLFGPIVVLACLAEELRKALCTKNVPAKVYVGMRYWHPFTEEAIEQIKRDGITKLVVLPLYPQFSISTSGSSLRLLESIFREDEYLVNMQHTVIPSWYQREGYIKAMADLIAKELGSFDCPDKVMIFFSAHGVPLAYVEEAGDPYKAEMEECVDLIMEELEKRRITNAYTLAYQVMMPPLE
ncbi:hypothetical protein RHMOL_Rhmol10G0172600 [Rhododendron molle]|uniref:Uncharacterized protein n=1 Tax=Rhododendron molle TaxID=49168 RepID=A0ACC0M341_RHOML|nr:hypothetical protein RHMOL_Rhmol10G0172600 [Rhododendron molle]